MKLNFENTLKEKQFRITTSRRVVFEVLSESSKSLSPKEVFENIELNSEIKTDQASVYRNLILFQELGLIHKLQDGKYSACSHGHSHEGHVHIIANCSECGVTHEVINHNSEICEKVKSIGKLIKSFSNFSGLTLEGKCKTCRSS